MEYDCKPVRQALTLMPVTHSVLNQIERAGSDKKKTEHSGRRRRTETIGESSHILYNITNISV